MESDKMGESLWTDEAIARIRAIADPVERERLAFTIGCPTDPLGMACREVVRHRTNHALIVGRLRDELECRMNVDEYRRLLKELDLPFDRESE